MNSLRPYQQLGCSAVCDKFLAEQATLLVLGTGLGKTRCAGEIIQRFQEIAPGKTCLFLAHRAELIYQAQTSIRDYTGLSVGIEMAFERASNTLFHRDKVIVSTIQTQIAGRETKRMHAFKPEDIGLVIIDEAHRSAADSYLQVLDYYKQNPNLRILGLTATPERTDERTLGEVFPSIAYQYGVLEGINDGWLVPIAQEFVPVSGLDYSDIDTVRGDFDQTQLAAMLEKDKIIAGICHPSLEIIFGMPEKTLSNIPRVDWHGFIKDWRNDPEHKARRTVIFTASVEQAKKCCDMLNSVAPKLAQSVDGETHKETRKEILGRFKSGHTPVIVNVGILTEGFDCPQIEVVIMGKATKSIVVYSQQLGRGTRALPGVVDGPECDTPEKRKGNIAKSDKKFLRVIDFVGNSGRHKVVDCFDVLSGNLGRDVIERARSKTKESRRKLVTAVLINAQSELKREAQERAKAAERKRNAIVVKSKFTHIDVPIDSSSFNSHHKNGKEAKPIPEHLLRKIRKHGMRDPVNLGQARALYGKCKKKEETMPIFPKDAANLTKEGYDTRGWTQAKACKAWTEWFNNGKKRPNNSTL